MRKLIFVLFLMLIVSCGKSPEEEFAAVLESFKASKADAADVIEALVLRRGGYLIDDEKVRSGVSSLFSVDRRKILLHGPAGSRKCILPEGAPFVAAVVSGEKCYIAAGRYLLVYHNSSSYDRVIKFPGNPVISALEVWPDGILALAGKKLYLLRKASENPELIFEKAFSSPDKKIYRGSLIRSNNFLAIVLGYAGRYHIALVDVAKQKIIAEKISAAGGSCYLDGKRVYYVSGGSGLWKITRFDGKTKIKKTVGSFKSIVNVSLFKEGFILETPQGIGLHDYKGTMIPFPVGGLLKGRTGENFVLTMEKGKTLVAPFGKFRNDIADLKRDVPGMFRASPDK